MNFENINEIHLKECAVLEFTWLREIRMDRKWIIRKKGFAY